MGQEIIFFLNTPIFYKQSIFDPRPSKRRHSLLQGDLEYVMHTFELASPKVSISLRFPMQKKGFSLFSRWIVWFSSLVRPGKLFRNCLKN